MKANLKPLMSSATDDWATPQDFFDSVNAELGPFTMDVCATKENKKCPSFYGLDVGIDGLTAPWHLNAIPGSKCWMNPPYGRVIGKWIAKASLEASKGCTVVALLPARTDTKYFHDYIYNKPGVEIRFLRGRLKFGGSKNSAPFPSMLVIFRPTL